MVRWWYSVDEWVPLLWVLPAEPAHLPQYVSLFALGVMANRVTGCADCAAGWAVHGSGIGFVASLCMAAVEKLAPDAGVNGKAGGGLGWRSAVRSTLEGLVCVGFAVGLLVVVRDRVRRPLRRASAMAATRYGAYILHLYIVVPMQVAMTGPDVSPFLKFGVVAVLSVLLLFGAARLTRRMPGIRRVLGAAPLPAVTTADLAQS